MLTPLNNLTANDLVEQYIGTAYDNVKAVADNATNINAVVANEENINLAAGLSANIDIVADNALNINKVAAIDAAVTTVAGIDTNVTTVAGMEANVATVVTETFKSPVTAVAADEVDIGLVAGSIGNVNIVASEPFKSQVTAVSADSSDIGIVAEDIDNVNTVAGLSGDMAAIQALSGDITQVASDLPAIQTAAGTVTLTVVELNLVVDGNTAVAGVSYPSVGDAVDYALTIMQAGGQLNLTIPAATTISETSTLVLDMNRMRVSITGDNSTDSIFETFAFGFGTGLTVTGDGFRLSSLKLTASGGGGGAGSALELSDSHNSFLAGIDTEDLSISNCDITISGCTFSAPVSTSTALTIVRSTAVLIANSFTSSEINYGPTVLRFRQSTVYMEGATTINASANGNASTGIEVTEGARCIITNAPTFTGDASIPYSPAANVEDALGSIIRVPVFA